MKMCKFDELVNFLHLALAVCLVDFDVTINTSKVTINFDACAIVMNNKVQDIHSKKGENVCTKFFLQNFLSNN